MPEVGALTYFLTEFFPKLHKSKRIFWPGGGGRPLRPIDPPKLLHTASVTRNVSGIALNKRDIMAF